MVKTYKKQSQKQQPKKSKKTSKEHPDVIQMTPEERNNFFLTDETIDNWMIIKQRLVALEKEIKFALELDVCTDSRGSNSLCKRFYTVKENSLLQNLAGEKMLVNPPFKAPEEFIEKLEDTKEENTSTKALLILPEWKQKPWFQKF